MFFSTFIIIIICCLCISAPPGEGQENEHTALQYPNCTVNQAASSSGYPLLPTHQYPHQYPQDPQYPQLPDNSNNPLYPNPQYPNSQFHQIPPNASFPGGSQCPPNSQYPSEYRGGMEQPPPYDPPPYDAHASDQTMVKTEPPGPVVS